MRNVPNSSIDYYILPNKICCSLTGMWPFDEDSSRWKTAFSRFRFIFSVIAFYTVFVLQLVLIGVNWGDLRILTEVGCVSTTLAQLMFKTTYLAITREKSYKLYNELRSLWDSSDDPEERQCYENLAYWARVCTVLLYSSGMLTVIVFTIPATMDYINDSKMNNDTGSGRHFPFDIWYGRDVSISPDFEIAFAVECVIALLALAGISGVDTTCMTVIFHVSGQFRLISRWISNIGVEINCQPTNYLTDYLPSYTASLVRCICHHQRLIHVVDDVNNLLMPIIFVQLLTSGIEICLSGFAVFSNGESKDLYKFISYLTSMMIQLFLWCWPGEMLVQESQDLGHSIYSNIPWYKLPPVYQKQLMLMILRSQKYCSISALTFQTLSVHTLTTVFNTAVSYFALLRQMQEKEALKNDLIM